MSNLIDKTRLDYRSSKPIYEQIAEQIQQLIATNQIRPGEQLPPVRRLGVLLDVSPNTVARAYMELERKNIVMSKRGGGTIVNTSRDVQTVKELRQKSLLDSINSDIIKMLSQGYDPEELEAAFYTSIERWREERRAAIEVSESAQPAAKQNKLIRIVGSHDIALNILVTLFRQHNKDTQVELNHVGSLGGLIALEEDKADLAGTHLLDEETGEYNIPFIKRVLPVRDIVVVNLVFRVQGLMFAQGNPKQIKGIADLRQPHISFINRQRGSGTRVLLDMHLKRNGIDPCDVQGYTNEMYTHIAVATAIAQGEADSGLGIEAAARSCGLDFLPLSWERYDLVIPEPLYQSKLVAPLLHLISSKEFKKIVNKVEGYDTSQTGTTTFVS